MKYMTGLVIVILGAVLIWVIFFSGIILKKTPIETNNTEETANEPLADNEDDEEEMLEQPHVVLETNLGNITVELSREKAPLTSANFEKLVRDGFYNTLIFHRVIAGFVIQGGDPRGTGQGGPGYNVPAEIGLLHKRGAIAMARLPDEINPQRESSGSQFYIALQDLPGLDGQYTVFGNVVSGMDVVDKIAAVQTDSADKPLAPVIINRAIFAPSK